MAEDTNQRLNTPAEQAHHARAAAQLEELDRELTDNLAYTCASRDVCANSDAYTCVCRWQPALPFSAE